MTGRPVWALAAATVSLVAFGCGGSDSAAPAGNGAGGAGTKEFPTCADGPPPGGVEAPDPPAYSGGACPTLTTGIDNRATITSSGKTRKFAVIVPDQPTAGAKLPVVFLWHW